MVQHLPGMSEALNSYTWDPHFTNDDHALVRACQRGHVSQLELESQPSGESPILRVKKLEFLGG